MDLGNIGVNEEKRSDDIIENNSVMLDGETCIMNRAIVIQDGTILNRMKSMLTCHFINFS